MKRRVDYEVRDRFCNLCEYKMMIKKIWRGVVKVRGVDMGPWQGRGGLGTDEGRWCTGYSFLELLPYTPPPPTHKKYNKDKRERKRNKLV